MTKLQIVSDSLESDFLNSVFWKTKILFWTCYFFLSRLVKTKLVRMENKKKRGRDLATSRSTSKLIFLGLVFDFFSELKNIFMFVRLCFLVLTSASLHFLYLFLYFIFYFYWYYFPWVIFWLACNKFCWKVAFKLTF